MFYICGMKPIIISDTDCVEPITENGWYEEQQSWFSAKFKVEQVAYGRFVSNLINGMRFSIASHILEKDLKRN